MNASRFDKVVKNRAQKRVEEKIQRFKDDVRKACQELNPKMLDSYRDGTRADTELCFANFIRAYFPKQGDNATHWPAILWATEEEEVQQTLLATMDEMSKALCAPDASASDVQPAIKAPEATS